jgi:hypothetical protein
MKGGICRGHMLSHPICQKCMGCLGHTSTGGQSARTGKRWTNFTQQGSRDTHLVPGLKPRNTITGYLHCYGYSLTLCPTPKSGQGCCICAYEMHIGVACTAVHVQTHLLSSTLAMAAASNVSRVQMSPY